MKCPDLHRKVIVFQPLPLWRERMFWQLDPQRQCIGWKFGKDDFPMQMWTFHLITSKNVFLKLDHYLLGGWRLLNMIFSASLDISCTLRKTYFCNLIPKPQMSWIAKKDWAFVLMSTFHSISSEALFLT